MKYLITYSCYIQEQLVLDLDIDLDKEYSKLNTDKSIYNFNRDFFLKLFKENKITDLENYRIIHWQKIEE